MEVQPKLVTLFSQVLDQLGFDLTDPNFKATPARMARSFEELLRGQADTARKVADEMRPLFPCRKNGLQVTGPVSLVGLCPHHLLPVHYTCSMGYIPNDAVVGLSKLPRMARILGARAVIQEDLVEDIADAMMEHLHPKGAIVQLTGSHDCLRIRGAHSDAFLVSEAVRGVFFDGPPQARAEALELIRINAQAAHTSSR